MLDNDEPREWRKRRDPVVHCRVLRSLHSTVLDKLKLINYPFEIPPPDTQHDLLSETILFGDDLYRSRLGDGLNPHILPVGVTTKIPTSHRRQ